MPVSRSPPRTRLGASRWTARISPIGTTGSPAMISATRPSDLPIPSSEASARSVSMGRRALIKRRSSITSKEPVPPMTWFQAPAITLPHLVALHGKWRGARTALVEGERRLSWREFERETARAANGLRALGLKSGDRVAVLMDNSLEMVVLLFGILRFGGVAVPLNVSISDGAVARMIEDADARAIFASHQHCRRIDELRVQSEPVARAVRVGLGAADPGWIEFNAWLGAQSP